jgi:hypothetical protein
VEVAYRDLSTDSVSHKVRIQEIIRWASQTLEPGNALPIAGFANHSLSTIDKLIAINTNLTQHFKIMEIAQCTTI